MSLILWDSTPSSRLKLTVQIQLIRHPCDPFSLNNCHMNANSVEKYFAVLNHGLLYNMEI